MLVVALTVAMTTVGAVMVTTIVNNDPILTQTSIQRYAYRALASGVNAYQNMINANPYLAACNSTTNPGAANATAQCAGISYQAWSKVPGTDVGNGVIPEYYKFDNPREVIDPTTNAITYLDVQVVGAAGFPGKDVYYSTVAKFTPANGFLDNVWWSNYEATGTPSTCQYYWATNYSNAGSCTPVYFAVNDSITGPVFSNDSIYIDGKPNFGANYPVTTADPYCQFVNPLNGSHGQPPSNKVTPSNNCYLTNHGGNQDIGTYDAATSSYGKGNYETDPHRQLGLGQLCRTGRLLLRRAHHHHHQRQPDDGVEPGDDVERDRQQPVQVRQQHQHLPHRRHEAPLPVNGVIFVNGGNNNTVSTANANPFDGYQESYSCGTKKSQDLLQNGGRPDLDRRVRWLLLRPDRHPRLRGGRLREWRSLRPADDRGQQQRDHRRPAHLRRLHLAGDGLPEQLQLQRRHQLRVHQRRARPHRLPVRRGEPPGGQLRQHPARLQLHQPGRATLRSEHLGWRPGRRQGLEIDASLLGLQNSFIVNNYDSGNPEGTLTVYGSIQQDARGAVGTFSGSSIVSGYRKEYLWDPRLPLCPPPYYLTPGTPSWSLVSSSESYTGTCPPMPPAQPTPSSTQPSYPISGSTTCTPAS